MAERAKTKYQGVYTSESRTRRHNGKPDTGYVIDYYDAQGKRQRKTVGWASGGMTAALANQIRMRTINAARSEHAVPAEAADLAPKEDIPTLTFGQAWERYKRDWMEAQGKSTHNEESLIGGHLRDFCHLPLRELTPYRIDCLMSGMRAKGLSAQYIRLAAGLVRRVMRRMRIWGLYDGPDPFQTVRMPLPNNARQRYLTPDEARLLLEELRVRSRQTWLMALISLHCGLRFGEVAALTYGDINFDDGTLYVRESKSGRARHAVMTPDVMAALRDLPGGYHSDLLFAGRSGEAMSAKSSTFQRAVDAVGLNNTGRMIRMPDGKTVPERITDARQKVVFHTLRHTYASWLAMAGERELSLADLLGHTSTAMTKRYTHLMENARRGTADKISSVFHGKPAAS